MTLPEFYKNNDKNICLMSIDKSLSKKSKDWFLHAFDYQYSYHFTWLGIPIIQFPQDIVAIQELIWKLKPDLIIETGIAHGGSLILSASILDLIGNGIVLGIDVDIRDHNKKIINQHPLKKRIQMIEGSSTSKKTIKQVYKIAENKKKILVLLDSKHTENHVLKELLAYSPLVQKGGYIVVFDTMIEEMPKNYFKNRPWDKGNNPKTAVRKFLKSDKRFKIDKAIEKKLLITSCPDGFLKCIK
ncbi:MAG: cephalosporin hydroxylase family protein [Nitrosarchaeum sp.]|nr:cephalosporin hydroxylase family protein [Nitrosarchaeum sp.]